MVEAEGPALTPWQIKDGHFNYSKLIVLLVEGIGGDIGPYM